MDTLLDLLPVTLIKPALGEGFSVNMMGMEGDRLAAINISKMKLPSPVIFLWKEGWGDRQVFFKAGLSKMFFIVLSGPSVPSLKMLSVFDPADLKLQFEALISSAFSTNQRPSELKLLGPQALLESKSWE